MSDPAAPSQPSLQQAPPALQRVGSVTATISSSCSGLSSTDALKQFRKIRAIGEGTFGKVFMIERVSTGETLVWKEMYYGSMNTKEKEQLVSEVNILRELQHKHVVKYWDRIIQREEKKIYIIMEYCSGGDVATIIRDHIKNRTWAEEEFIWKILTEVAQALQECHRKCSGTILHRDLKPANIFLDSPTTKCVKLGDFGLARTLKDSFDYAKTHVGTPFYMSPEQVMETQYNSKSDIWSLGCLIYELAALSPPFKAQNHLALATKIRAGVYSRIPSRYSDELSRVIQGMIQVEQSKRTSVEQILKHPRIVARMQADAARERRALLAQQSAAAASAAAAAGVSPIPSLSSPTSCSSCVATAASLAQAQRSLREEAAQLAQRSDDIARREAAVQERERKAREREAALDAREMKLLKQGGGSLNIGSGQPAPSLYRNPLQQMNINQPLTARPVSRPIV